MGESLWAGVCGEATGGPAGGQALGTKSDFSLQHSRSPWSSLGVESPSPSVEPSEGPPSHHQASGRVSPSWGARLGTPGLQLPTPRGQEPPPLGVPTSLRTSPLSLEGGTAPFRPTAPRMSSRTNTHGPGSDAELASLGAHTPQDGLSPEASTPHCRRRRVSHSLTDLETGRRES